MSFLSVWIIYTTNTRLLSHRFLVATYLFTRGWLLCTLPEILTSKGRLFDVPPMEGFFTLYIKIEKDSSGLFVAQCYPGGTESSGGSFMVSFIPNNGLIPRLVQRGEQFVTSFCCTTQARRWRREETIK